MTLAFEHFAFISDLVRRRSGIRLETGKEYLVEARLMPLAKAIGLTSVEAYVRHVRASNSPTDLVDIVEALTTNETSWFRDVTPFNALRDVIVPALRRTRTLDRVSVWSAACSTGQEPYSIAMTLAEVLPPSTRVDILATDLNTEVLAKARQGVYSRVEINRGLPAGMLVRHFTTEGTQWRVNQTLRSQIRFAEHNLLATPPAGGPFDVVFLRNVLIYFDVPTKRTVLERVASVVRPGGFLVLGGAETTIGVEDSWERITTERGSVYRRRDPAQPAPAGPTWSPRPTTSLTSPAPSTFARTSVTALRGETR